MNIYKELDNFLKEEENSCEELLKEVLKEIQELKNLLQKENTKEYYTFVNRLKKEFERDFKQRIFPTIFYENQRYGINEKGFIYNKDNSKIIPAYKAFEIYKFLYRNRKNLSKFIQK